MSCSPTIHGTKKCVTLIEDSVLLMTLEPFSHCSQLSSSAQLDFLGCGHHGFTILAVDTSKGDAVAIKVLRCNDHVPP